MSPLLALPASLLKAGKAMRKKKKLNTEEDSSIKEITGADLLGIDSIEPRKSSSASENEGLLGPFVEPLEMDLPAPPAQGKTSTIEDLQLLCNKSDTGSRFESMPVEITQMILGYLDDYDDLLNAIVASRVVHFIFGGAGARIQKQVTLNSINPEVMNSLLATFNIRRDRFPAQYDASRLPEMTDQEFIRAHRSFILDHIRDHVSGTVIFPFPTARSEIGELYHLYETVRTVAARFVAQSLFFSDAVLRTKNLLPAGSGIPLTKEENVRLEKSLLQYELMARAVGQPIGEQQPLLSRSGYNILIRSMDPVEFQQLATVDAWMLHEYRRWNRELQQSFTKDIVEASKRAGAPLRPGPPEPTQKMVSGAKSRMINARVAMQAADVEQALPYLCRKPVWDRGCWESDRMLARLQSLGLTFFKDMCKKSAPERTQTMLEAHKHLEYLNSNFLGTAGSAYAARHGALPRVWCNYMKLDHGSFPNTFVEQLVMTLGHDAELMGDEARRFLLRTGWWFWGDARLKAMGFEKITVLDDDITDLERHYRLARWAFHNLVARRSDPVLPHQRIGKDVELPLGEWKKIVLKYQKAGTQLPDFFLADDHLVMAKQMWT
ncbi:hypothetical protein F5Y17DRAFT_33186 [Xylariaceae sp. FL0594]|nr:hypothetical protein F5Y17DRAFT_33186 [Xylariaceae sp. FL0594]